MKFRIEKDSLGSIEVPSHAYWGAQTERARKNFMIGDQRMPLEVIHAIALIKKAAAEANLECMVLDKAKAEAICRASDEIMEGSLDDHFPLTIWQSGSGTQTNMNVNEVIANRASEILGCGKGAVGIVHPNDDVNKSQSTNDVFPSAMHISSFKMLVGHTIPSLDLLRNYLIEKSREFMGIIKTGRTHYMDAVPVSLGQEFSAYSSQAGHGIRAVEKSLEGLSELAIGGTAVGTGINTPRGYTESVTRRIIKLTGLPFVSAPDKFEALASHDALVESSGALKRVAAALMKISGDIRFMASGPRCGIGELILPENEPGSSIMPGKTNPSQAEALAMVCVQVIGNDAAITLGGLSGNLELNAYKPVIIHNFLESARLLGSAARSFSEMCIAGIKPDLENIRNNLNKSLMLVTALNPISGYDRAAEIARKAYNEGITLKEAAINLGYLTEEEFDKYIVPENMVFFDK